ncbi:MAG TPA: tetratricopeptide repeat protein [Thermoanaerobaculia bacterium]|nr:tetratricopeptide repeat protein [Thermoanaerobaculia bacterium]
MKRVLILALLALPATAGPPSTCGGTDEYSRALCAYQRRDFQAAEKLLGGIIEAGRSDPQTMKARYFLGRTLMKRGQFAEAADVFIRIYKDDKPFYHAWNCDFLLGECRRALGKS